MLTDKGEMSNVMSGTPLCRRCGKATENPFQVLDRETDRDFCMSCRWIYAQDRREWGRSFVRDSAPQDLKGFVWETWDMQEK